MTPIEKIREQIRNHASNNWAKKKGWEPLFTASKSSRIVLIGQAPGIRAQTSGVPWDDLSGKRLRDWLGVTVEQFYNPENIALVPMDFYYPGKGKSGDLPPRKDFANRWHPKLFALMPNIKFIILVGQYSQGYYLNNKKKSLTQTVQSFEEYLPRYFPLPHPSPRNGIWLKKNPWFEQTVLQRLKLQVQRALALSP